MFYFITNLQTKTQYLIKLIYLCRIGDNVTLSCSVIGTKIRNSKTLFIIFIHCIIFVRNIYNLAYTVKCSFVMVMHIYQLLSN